MAKPKTFQTADAGVTLLELLVVLAIIGGVIGAITYAMPRFEEDTPEAFRDRLVRFLADERIAALAVAGGYRVHLSLTDRRVVSGSGRSLAIPEAIELTLDSARRDPTHGAIVHYLPTAAEPKAEWTIKSGNRVVRLEGSDG